MSESRMIFISDKESFISRVLIKKAQDAGADCSFVPWSIDKINANMEGVSLVTLFIEETDPGDDLVHYLVDMLEEKGLQMAVVGGQYEVQRVIDRVPGELWIMRTLPQPSRNTSQRRMRENSKKASWW